MAIPDASAAAATATPTTSPSTNTNNVGSTTAVDPKTNKQPNGSHKVHVDYVQSASGQKGHHNNNEIKVGSESDWSEEEEIAALETEYLANASGHGRVASTARLNQALKRNKEGRVKAGNEHFTSLSRMRQDGRVNISVSETARAGYLAKALGTSLERQTNADAMQGERDAERERNRILQEKGEFSVPSMNIVIMVIGSRGDITPFLKIGKILKEKYNHRVRIASHPKFRSFVEDDIGLEFFSVGGDPSQLMAYMVKNPGLMPSIETIKAGEITRRRDDMTTMMQGFWRACINTTDEDPDAPVVSKSNPDKAPFIADAIIANPPSFAHYHCAEKLGCPLHLVFTFPYTPTQAFPHPLANIKTSNVDPHFTNYMSYPMVDLLTWQGLGDLVNKFRIHTLGLEPVSTLWAPGQFTRMRVPTTYMWSPSLVPKPADWGPEIDVVGYVFLDLADSYKPPEDLAEFLRRDGPDRRPLIYIGFGSISGISDPDAFARLVFDAVEKADVRAIISRGWGGMGDGMQKPDGVFMVDSVPHDWLFPQLDAVVHHGGAGTTANGLKFGKPTMIVPFFGDQPFWSAMVAQAGAGAKESLPLKKLDADKFAKGIRECLTPEAKAKAQEIAQAIANDGDGAQNTVDSFHRSLPLENPRTTMKCSVFPDRAAVWHLKHVDKHVDIRLSALAAYLLVENKSLDWSDLSLMSHRRWFDFQGPGEPITGAAGAIVSSFQDAVQGIESISESAKRDRKRRQEAKKTKKGVSGQNGAAQPVDSASLDASKKKLQRPKTDSELNLSGEADPLRFPFKSRRKTGRSNSLSSLDPGRHAMARDVSVGLSQSARAIVRIPADMLYAFTLGFRNAPRLYGDQTVRPMTRPITGFRRGVKTAGSEFYHGIYDGVTGVVILPVHDVREGGFGELPKGIARGVGGLVLKPLAGTLGLVAYTGRGAVESLHSILRDTSKTKRWIRRARALQGMREANLLNQQQNQQQNQGTTSTSTSTARPSGAQSQHANELEKLRSVALTKWNSQKNDAGAVSAATTTATSEPRKLPAKSVTA